MEEHKIIKPKNPFPQFLKSLSINRWVFVISILLALGAWIYGYFNNGTDVLSKVPDVLPNAAKVEVRSNLFVGYDQQGNLTGYAATGQAQGYAGPMEMLVGINPAGEITGTEIITERDTPGFFRLILGQNLPGEFVGLQYNAPLSIGQDVEGVSGATLSSEGVAASIRAAVRNIAKNGLNSPLPATKTPIQFGIPEIALICLYAAGYFGHKARSGKVKRGVRWGTLIIGMVVIGFIYTVPLTISMIISLLSGYWPDWHTNLYWYLLIGGILFVTTVDSKNPYCSWFCPFGAVQECLAKLTGAKLYRPHGWSIFFTWLQRGLAFAAVLIGLALRSPGVSSYEPFATLFDLRGTAPEWIFLAIILIASLIMYRPFCNYLCPLDPVYDFIAEGRRWVREVWRRTGKHLWKK